MPEPGSDVGVLRIRLSTHVGADALRRLHRGEAEDTLGALLAQAGCGGPKPVYSLSDDEIARDAYGFAREFSVTVKAGADPEAARRVLVGSPLVENVRPVALRRGMGDYAGPGGRGR